MDASFKVVTRLPLTELWQGDKFTTTTRLRWLGGEEIASLLRAGRVQFVVADVGAPLLWISPGECYDFWKTKAQPHLAAPDSCAALDKFPDDYCYFASEWSSPDGLPIIVCERHH